MLAALAAAPGGVSRIQASLREELQACGLTRALEEAIRAAFESGRPPRDEDEMLDRLVDEVRDSVQTGEGRFAIGGDAVARMVEAVRQEMERCCVCVDGAEWME